jgi:L-threonylcarbamoyladenylate synthase
VSSWLLNKYALQIKKGAVFAYPTDTIWGLGCDPENAQAIQRILQIKNRSVSKGMILLANSIDYCTPYIDRDYFTQQREQICRIEQSPTTWLVPASASCPPWLTGNHHSVAIRLTDIPHISRLCNALKIPLISTSANYSGHTPVRNAFLSHRHFANRVDFIIHSSVKGSEKASRIIDMKSGKIIRA